MAYTDDAVLAKLSALNETQEGIVTVAQWIMFHRRHADRTAHLWQQKLLDSSPSKRLNLIYLANEVVQQSKVRKKTEFLASFSGTYKNAGQEIQLKIRRVIEVWQQRQIFEPEIQENIEAKVDEIDRNRLVGRKPGLGGSSLFAAVSASVPKELQTLVTHQNAIHKSDTILSSHSATNSDAEFEKLTNADQNGSLPSPPVYAARLSSLLKSLASIEGAVTDGIIARQSLVKELQNLLELNNAAIKVAEARKKQLNDRRGLVEAKKHEIEDTIMRGLAEESGQLEQSSGACVQEGAAAGVFAGIGSDNVPDQARTDISETVSKMISNIIPSVIPSNNNAQPVVASSMLTVDQSVVPGVGQFSGAPFSDKDRGEPFLITPANAPSSASDGYPILPKLDQHQYPHPRRPRLESITPERDVQKRKLENESETDTRPLAFL